MAPVSPTARVAQATRSPLSLRLTDLGRVIGLSAGRASEARDINTGGNVVGWCEVPGPIYAIPRAVVWRDGQIADLRTLGGLVSRAWAINADGVVVGESYTPGNAGIPAGMWRDGVITDLRTLAGSGDEFGSMAYGIDPSGRIVGRSHTLLRVYHAVMWEGSGVTDLGTLGGATSVAHVINPSGTVVGSSEITTGATHAFLWRKGTMTDLGTLYGTPSSGAFLWQQGKMVELPGVLREVPGLSGEGVPHAYAINPAGRIVGDGRTDYKPHAALWSR